MDGAPLTDQHGRLDHDTSSAELAPLAPAPPLLESHSVEAHHQDLLAEYRPVGPTEHAIVRDLARQVAAMERWGTGTDAVAREVARHLTTFSAAENTFAADAAVAAALSSEATDRCDRHALAHTRAFYRALQKLRELQAERMRRASGMSAPPPGFADEAACEAYLAERFQRGHYPCARCGTSQGYYYPERRAWECKGCHAQVGLRSGTVMARSQLALESWFEAIRWLLWQPTISTAELAAQIGVRRLSTVRRMSEQIRAAMAADNASQRLAGLDQHFAHAARRT